MTNQRRSDLPFDLVVLDLDGTILDLYHHRPISPVVIEAIAAVQAAGIPVSIGTGRTLDYIRTHVGHLGITTPVITTQGAVIGDPVTGHVLDETNIPLDLAREAVAWIDSHPYIAALYFTDAEGHTHIYQNRSGPMRDFYDHVFGLPRSYRDPFAPMLEADDAHPPVKFIVINDPAEGDIVPELTTRFSPGLTITRTHPILVEGTAEGVDKGRGLRRLCEILGIDPGRVLAIGDSDNDIPLLAAAGYGVAMGNATEGVLAIADWVAPRVEEDGCATALQTLILDALGG
jgi:Cof subfamily protein (haloacid dehalogenase superfamily)